jgi:hypothetical protein
VHHLANNAFQSTTIRRIVELFLREGSMRGSNRRFKLLSAALLFGSAAALSGTAFGQFPTLPPPKGPDPNERVVSLVRQDQSDCQNGNVSDQDSSLVGGTAYVLRGSDGKTTVKVGISAKPNTKYHFFLKCVRILGDVETWDEGAGEAVFTFNTSETGNVYAFDVYPEGAPPGNKYQSVQVKY